VSSLAPDGCGRWQTAEGRPDARQAIGYAAARLSCVIEANFPGLDKERIENLAIEFAYRLFMAQRDH
jgi:hypothetical protein